MNKITCCRCAFKTLLTMVMFKWMTCAQVTAEWVHISYAVDAIVLAGTNFTPIHRLTAMAVMMCEHAHTHTHWHTERWHFPPFAGCRQKRRVWNGIDGFLYNLLSVVLSSSGNARSKSEWFFFFYLFIFIFFSLREQLIHDLVFFSCEKKI